MLKQQQDANAAKAVSTYNNLQQPQQQLQTPEVEIRYVRVPETDYAAEGFRKSIAAEASANEHLLPLLERIERNAKVWANGLRSQKRMYNVGPEPPEIVVKTEEHK